MEQDIFSALKQLESKKPIKCQKHNQKFGLICMDPQSDYQNLFQVKCSLCLYEQQSLLQYIDYPQSLASLINTKLKAVQLNEKSVLENEEKVRQIIQGYSILAGNITQYISYLENLRGEIIADQQDYMRKFGIKKEGEDNLGSTSNFVGKWDPLILHLILELEQADSHTKENQVLKKLLRYFTVTENRVQLKEYHEVIQQENLRILTHINEINKLIIDTGHQISKEINQFLEAPQEIILRPIDKQIFENYQFDNFDSSILKGRDFKVIQTWMGLPHRKVEFQPIFRARRDGFENFHSLCDDQGPTLVVCRSGNDQIFGGVSYPSWSSSGTYIEDKEGKSFLFSLTFGKKFNLLKDKVQYAMCGKKDYGPIYGNDIGIKGNGENDPEWSWFGHTFEVPEDVPPQSEISKQYFTAEFNYKLLDLEVFTFEIL